MPRYSVLIESEIIIALSAHDVLKAGTQKHYNIHIYVKCYFLQTCLSCYVLRFCKVTSVNSYSYFWLYVMLDYFVILWLSYMATTDALNKDSANAEPTVFLL